MVMMQEQSIPKWVELEEQRTRKRAEEKAKTYEECLEAGVLSYEEICDHSRDKIEKMGLDRWAIGDDAALVDTKYGEHTMEDFARDIGGNKSTIAGYYRVSKFYPNIIRRKLLDNLPNLTYSHYKDALRLTDLDAAIAWLDEVAQAGWSPDKASYELTQRLGKDDDKPSPIPGKIERVDIWEGNMAMVSISISMDDYEAVSKFIGSTISLKAKGL